MNRGIVRAHAVALLALVVLARALVPTGWMPGDGGLIPCDGHAHSVQAGHIGPMPAHAPMRMAAHAQQDTHGKQPEPAHPNHRGSDGVCPFAATAFATPAFGVHADAIVAFVTITTSAIVREAAPERHIAFAGSPRGPPLSV